MRQRDYVLEQDDDMGTGGTKIYNLDFSDPITEIVLGFSAINGTNHNKDNPIERNISKVEITDGGQVLWDCPGDVAFAAYSTLRGAIPRGDRVGAANGTPDLWLPIQFGRYPYDPEFAFNPVAHKNPQLKITFDEATVRSAGADGFSSDSFTVTIIVRLMEDAPAPGSYLTYREIQEFTSLANGDTKIEMPTDRVIRAIFTRVYQTEVYMGTNISNFKLSADGGKFVPFDLEDTDLIALMTHRFPQLVLNDYTVADSGENRETWVGVADDGWGRPHVAGETLGIYSPYNGIVACTITTHAGAPKNNAAIHFGIAGWCIHNTLVIPFGRLDVPDDWFKAQEYRKLDYFLTNGGAGAEVNVVVQQVYPY